MARQSTNSLSAYTLIGIISSLPFFIVYAAVVLIAILNEWPEWLGPVVGLLFWLFAAWGGSFVSGLICRRMLAYRSGIAPLLLANSAGWVMLVFIGVGLVAGLFSVERGTALLILLIAFAVSVVGFLITWATMRRDLGLRNTTGTSGDSSSKY